MHIQRQHAGRLLYFAAIASVVVSYLILYHAGCVGDTKAASFGDPVRALRLEEFAGLLYLLAMVSTTAAFIAKSESFPWKAAAISVGLFLLGYPLYSLIGFQVEMSAAGHCQAQDVGIRSVSAPSRDRL